MATRNAILWAITKKVKALIDNGALLGRLWMQGHFGIGDPLYGGGSSTLEAIA